MPSKFIKPDYKHYKTYEGVEVGKFYFYTGNKPTDGYAGQHPSRLGKVLVKLDDNNLKYPLSKLLLVVRKAEQSFVQAIQGDQIFWFCLNPFWGNPALIPVDLELNPEFDPETP